MRSAVMYAALSVVIGVACAEAPVSYDTAPAITSAAAAKVSVYVEPAIDNSPDVQTNWVALSGGGPAALRTALQSAGFHVVVDPREPWSLRAQLKAKREGATQHRLTLVLFDHAGEAVISESRVCGGFTNMDSFAQTAPGSIVGALVRNTWFANYLQQGPTSGAPRPQEAASATAPREAKLQSPSKATNVGVVAVLPLDVRGASLDSPTKLALEEEIRTAIGDSLASYGYTVLTGDTTLSYMTDNGISAEKVCDATCALAAARELKAKLFLSGLVAKSEGQFVAFIRIYESGTGRQLDSVHVEGDSVRSLRQQFEKQAEEFIRKALARIPPP